MKPKKWIVLILMAAMWLVPFQAYAAEIMDYKPGMILGKAQKSTTKFFINGAQVPSVTFNGKLVVFTKDLASYGFITEWDNENRSIAITRNLKVNSFKAVKDTTSSKPINVSNTDIRVFVENRMIPAFYIGSGTAIYADDLFRYGAISYDTKLKQQRLLLSKYAVKDMPMYEEVDAHGNSFYYSSLTDNPIAHLKYDVFYYNRVTKKVESFKESSNLIDANLPNEATEEWNFWSIAGEDAFWKYVFVGLVFETAIDNTNTTLTNPVFNEESKYIKTKYLDYILMLEKARMSELTKELKAHGNKPVKVVESKVEHNDIGVPELYMTFKNLSAKTVDAFEIEALCYDAFGRPVEYPGYGNTYLAQSRSIVLPPGSEDTFVATLDEFMGTAKVELKVVSVHFTDGTTWKLK
ncbi:hypothetical protein ACFQZE_16960 [Paenibacillus sp. GCM10027627]|uniref:hypothetical protein n=1 Tax=unclassified Paenibacillus TaxID=185978 RepID=UPI00363128FE